MSQEDLEAIERILDDQVQANHKMDKIMQTRWGSFSLIALRNKVRQELMNLVKRPQTV